MRKWKKFLLSWLEQHTFDRQPSEKDQKKGMIARTLKQAKWTRESLFFSLLSRKPVPHCHRRRRRQCHMQHTTEHRHLSTDFFICIIFSVFVKETSYKLRQHQYSHHRPTPRATPPAPRHEPTIYATNQHQKVTAWMLGGQERQNEAITTKTCKARKKSSFWRKKK